jgi:hypothetical protein
VVNIQVAFEGVFLVMWLAAVEVEKLAATAPLVAERQHENCVQLYLACPKLLGLPPNPRTPRSALYQLLFPLGEHPAAVLVKLRAPAFT